MKFKQLTINNWKQFEKLDIEFHPNLTVLTGANGAGKTTILNMLARHFGWNITELATPAKDKKTGGFRFFTWFFKKPLGLSQKDPEANPIIGTLSYTNGESANLIIPNSDSPQYKINIVPIQPVKGFNIHSHRPLFTYVKVPHIPLSKRTPKEAFDIISNNGRVRIMGGGGHPANYFIKETLLLWENQGYGSKVREPDDEVRRYYEGFQKTLTKVLPKSLGFKEFVLRSGEIVIITESGDFMLDAVSGGIGALIDLAWKIYLIHLDKPGQITILIDEAENHLHASMQREMLPNFLDAFPDVQFVVSTHSPLIIGSVKDSNVYALRYTSQNGEGNKVISEMLDLENKASNATQVLNEVLGVPFTMPIWVENALNDTVGKHTKGEMDEKVFDKMRAELKEIGLEDLMPMAIRDTIRKKG